MRVSQKILFFVFILVGITLVSNFSNAQNTLIGADTGKISLIPNSPRPDGLVKAIFESYITDLSNAKITWLVNGQVIIEGIGESEIRFKNGSVGEKTSIQVIVLTEEGWPIGDKLEIYSADVGLIYEAKSSTPPFYKGKAKLPYEGVARVIAVPNFKDETGKIIPVEDLIFKWYRKGKLELSGMGKNIFTFRSSVPMSTNEIKVEVSTIDRRYFTEKYIEFFQFRSQINLYENNPEYGILYNKALNETVNLNKAEMSVVAEPFFFNILDLSSLGFKWVLGGKALNNPINSIDLAGSNTQSGSSFMSVEIRNPNSIYQYADKSVNIQVN